MPLELKTGRSSFSAEHKGQVTLYSMMMNQQNGERKVTDGSPGGLLLYLKDGAIQHVPAGHNEKQGLVQLRNEMVKYLTSPTTTSEKGEISEGPLPTRIDRVNQCNSCPLRVECTIYQIAEDSANETTPSMPLPLESVEHLTSAHQNYFLHWSKMLRLEFEESQARSRSISDIWCIDPLDREAQGYCISFLQVENCLASQNPTSELNQYSIKLVPANRIHLPTRISLQRGDSVVLSTDKEVAVATGCLVDISTSSVTVSTDRNVHNWDRNFEVLHLDKMEYQGGQTLLYANLSRLMANNANAAKLRELVIDLKLPVFKAGLPKSLLEVLWPVLRPLNAFQRRAVLKALTCEDYCLINGLPGTGKTSLIVALIRLAVRLGQSVLLTSYTHSAVDNVLLKLCQFNDVEFLRIGREHRTHPSILPYSAETKTKNCHTVEELETVYSVPVIAATCLSVGHPALIRRKFDLCIVDEAAQALQLAVLGPLTAAKKFVLVGDPLQLPPVVQSRTAKSLGMDESLFVRLSRVTPKASETLKLQYRMCGPVNALANKLTYGGELECGSEVIEQATLQLPSLTSIEQEYADRPWLLSVIKPGLRHAVVFLDTSLLGAIKANHSEIDSDESNKSPINHLEAKLALLIVKTLRGSGLPYDQMGIIAPYQSQVQHLKQAAVEMPEVEINTVDQYQGRDKEAIIYSCTKSERDGESTVAEGTQTILHDIRRLTVALTRAKHKLIVIGDSQTLQSFPPFAKLLASLEASQRYQLCPGRDQI
ncbi:DNA replication ATP-dependent helicase/nuclease DNA2 [Daphnia magna]|uniref:DNA replication ATP-dependent helicase/nuclease n=1 Tax=Daphnia magna TaxID=35525 RepID=A0A162CC26_9CRUS|nr:DNA replication ATP-dependent helicase/nuclease DNA2 [Daphnia magna]